MHRWAAIPTLLAALIFVGGCHPRTHRLDLSELGSPAAVTRQALLDHPRTRIVVGDCPTVLDQTFSEGSASAPFGLFHRELIVSRVRVSGSKSHAFLSYELRSRGNGPWRLTEWSIEPIYHTDGSNFAPEP